MARTKAKSTRSGQGSRQQAPDHREAQPAPPESQVIKNKRKLSRPMMIAEREIRREQKSVDLLMNRHKFKKLVQWCVQDWLPDGRLGKGVLEILMEQAQAELITMFEEAALAATHDNRVTIMVKDVRFCFRARSEKRCVPGHGFRCQYWVSPKSTNHDGQTASQEPAAASSLTPPSASSQLPQPATSN